MKTNIIRLKDCKNSKRYANWCWQTSAINTNVKYFDAVIPDEVDELMSGLRIEWKYPWTGELNDMKSGLTLRAYQTADPKKILACLL